MIGGEDKVKTEIKMITVEDGVKVKAVSGLKR